MRSSVGICRSVPNVKPGKGYKDVGMRTKEDRPDSQAFLDFFAMGIEVGIRIFLVLTTNAAT